MLAIANDSPEPTYEAPKIAAVDQDEQSVDLGAIFATGYTLVYF